MNKDEEITLFGCREETIVKKLRYCKKILQWLIGLFIIIGTVLKILSTTGLFNYDIFGIFNWVHTGNKPPSFLETVGYALAISASIELGYMLFTEGPDEAVEPAILGVASLILIGISKDDPFNFKISFSLLIYTIILSILLHLKYKYIDQNKY